MSADPIAAVQADVLALADALRARRVRLVTAESCTGGLIAAACTAIAGSSDWFDRGVVTYSNEAKTELLGVPSATLRRHGAVSEPVARAMAEGALARAPAGLSLAVTGIAGPGGGSPAKPVGTVWLAWATPAGGVHARLLQLDGDRAAIRLQTMQHALQAGLQAL